ncbi:helix-turn-helix domain-containing protein [Litorihabitans aurantiacus]|uniref:Helix-turn-helix domain-containing protein n=1 Tax=Litorihabitans aurantiacus TaxID=1930061 RepID=A0AA38CQZ9_9MICO|nr:helix-turn-helix domain-containing protein [Litorihabitans aurantiacus]GMA31571.1 hypothetical protein GCM10025875_15630 [Litorihabitans aurantiacus]
MTTPAAALPLVPLLSVDAVADLLGESAWTVRLLIRRGDLDAHRVGRGTRGKYRVHPDAVRAFLNERATGH